MVDVDPPAGLVTGMVLEIQGIDSWILSPSWGTSVLVVILGREGEGIEVGSGSRKFHPRNGGDFTLQSQGLNGRRPVHDSVVFRSRGKFNMFGCQVDQAIRCSTNIITTGGGMVMEVGAYPASRVN